MPRYDAFLLVSFGGPENPDEVIPFLQNVTAGRSIPTGRLAEVAGHYYLFGGVSPLNQQCRDLIAAVGKDFAARGIDLPVYWGNRNWQPYLTGTLPAMASAGVPPAPGSWPTISTGPGGTSARRPRRSTRSGSTPTIPALPSRWLTLRLPLSS